MKEAIGGGRKKVLYTLQTARRIGLLNSAKALTAHNACKACGLGMGGQRGGMTNELGEFPAVCNKSIQAQSTDIQRPIPIEIFDHPVAELRELSGHELEHLGRLGEPVYKSADSDRYRAVDWEWAIDRAAERFAATEAHKTFFYSSGRSSNEAGFVLQLLARLYGTNNVNNCSYYCHQATSVALASTVGTGTATVELDDLSDCDLIFVIGANPASNHPRFIHKLKACRDRGGDVVIINPAREPGLVRFAVPKSAKSMLTGGTWIASEYLQPRIGTDIALLKGLTKAVLENGDEVPEFIEQHTHGFAAFRDDIEATGWDTIVASCGVSREDIERVARVYGRSERAVFAWGMGTTHHTHGVENIEQISNLALLRGMVGKRYAGLLPLRGHSNVQGIGTIGVKPVLPDEVFARMEKEFGISLPRDPGYDTLAGLAAASEGRIKAALIMGGNLYGATPDAGWAAAAMERIGFKLFLTTTLNKGHTCGVDGGESLILPVAARDEELEPTTQESMFNYVRLSDGGIRRLANVRPEVTILADLAERLLRGVPIDFSRFRSHRTIRQAIAKIVPGMEELQDIDVARREFHINGRLLHAPEFRTPSRRARFVVTDIPADAAETLRRQYPFRLATVRSEGQFNTMIYEEQDSYRGTRSRWSVLMNADDMQAMGIGDGDEVDLVSPQGEMAGVEARSFGVPRGNALAYFPEANVLIGRDSDPRSKTPAFKSVAVRIERRSNG
jgi:molybdopterin-dependent oxidoreductase alpha subunit